MAAKSTGGNIIPHRASNHIYGARGQVSLLVTVLFGIKSKIVLVSADGTGQAEMGPTEGVSHAAGRNNKGLDDKGTKNKSENKGDNQRLKGFPDRAEGTALLYRLGCVKHIINNPLYNT